MSDGIWRETNFEHYITRRLAEHGWVVSQDDTGFDPHDALFLDDFISYASAVNPDKVARMRKDFGESWRGNLEKALVGSLDRYGTVLTLRNGFAMAGYQTIDCSGHYPDDPRIPELKKKYDANILRVMHQVHYQTAGRKSLDLVFFINGIPVATAEVKTEMTQAVQDAVIEYQTERKPIEPDTHRKNTLLMYKRGAVVHFAISEGEIWMCTNLDADVPRFLPFNKGTSDGHAGNDPMGDDGDYPTSYFWNDICKRENWIRIFHDFVFESVVRQEDATGKLREVHRQLFPRFHQWRCVTRCLQDVRQNGVGQRYLIEHSAGSGKTETISWTAHELINVRKPDGEKLFSSVIVVTDRIGLDTNIKRTITQLRKMPGLIEMIGGDGDARPQRAKNKQLADALHDKREIIVVTLQTFPYALERIATDEALVGANFAVLIDEAHSAQTGQFAGKMKAALRLAAKEKSKETGDPDAVVTDEEMILAYFKQQQKTSTWPPNVSFFAYTATPKSETKTLFGRPSDRIDKKTGRPIPESFDLYPMRQAIEEGYILDVLQGYMPYKTAYKLKDDVASDKLVDEGDAVRTIAKWEAMHPTNVMQKTQFIIEHFMRNVSKMLGGQAKAMIVASSRPAVIRYKYAIDAYLKAHPEYDRAVVSEAIRFQVPGEPLVAFSGKVHGTAAITKEDPYMVTECDYLKENPFAAIRRDYDYTEANTNDLGRQTVESAFDKPENRIIIVCDKFQTGFNQPKLCAMYVDKRLGNDIEIVQTYSRLNRTFPGKDHVYVIDFVNDPQDVQHAFEKYDHGAHMARTQRLEVVYDIKRRLDAQSIYTKGDIDAFCKVRYEAIDAGTDAVKDAYRRQLYQAVSGPAQRWNSAYRENGKACEQWTRRKDEAMQLGSTDRLDEAERKLREISGQREDLMSFKADLRKYCSVYTYISQVVDLGDPELEICYEFSKLLLKRLGRAALEDVDISSIVLSDYKIVPADKQECAVSDDGVALRPRGVGSEASGTRQASLKQIVDRLNAAFGDDVAPVQGALAVNAIVDSVSADDVSRIQIRNSTNCRDAVIADGRLESIIKSAALSLKGNELGQLAVKILDDPQAMRPIAELIYDLVSQRKHLDIEEISAYEQA